MKSLIIIALMLGLPVPESLGRPVAHQLEVCCSMESWPVPGLAARLRRTLTLPRMAELGYLPPPGMVREAARFNRRHAEWLETRWLIADTDRLIWAGWRCANQHLGDWWDAAGDAWMPCWCVWTRRQALGRCRAMMTREDWHHLRWPPPAPYWFFTVE